MEIRDLFDLENEIAFQKLNQQVNSFNPLKVLRIEHYEIRHSNILAWLFNPKENHRLNDYFLRKVLEHLLLMDENLDNPQYSAVGSILNQSLMESHVFREVKTHNNRYIDLVIVNQQLQTVFIIENKFYSSESFNQLNDYLAHIQNISPDFTIIPIYLTIDGETPSNEHYFTLSYERIEYILQHLLLLFEGQLNAQAYAFIAHYQEILREKFYPDQEQIVQAFDIYKQHRKTLEYLEEQLPHHHQLHFEAGYEFEFISKYKNTIQYILKHGNNILSYSFEQFIKLQFDGEVLNQAHPTVPNLVPPEWLVSGTLPMKEPNYWLQHGLIIWFSKTNDNRLKVIAEIGPIQHEERLALIQKLEQSGMTFKESSKTEKARYTRIYSKKIDISKWDDADELAQGMVTLYNDEAFLMLREQVAAALRNEHVLPEQRPINLHVSPASNADQVSQIFKKWAGQNQIPENDYRISTKHISFIIPLFNDFKEILGETQIKWWWNNGPFLFWYEYSEHEIYFTLEVGPIEAEKRVPLLEAIQSADIKFRKQGLKPDAKYTRIYIKRMYIESLDEAALMKQFDELYHNEELQRIINTLQDIYTAMLE